MKKTLKNLALAFTAVFFLACSKSDDNGNIDSGKGEVMKVEITNTGKLSDYSDNLVLQIGTIDDKVINVEGEDWDDTIVNMPAIIFKKGGEVKEKRILTTTEKVFSVTVAYGLYNETETEEVVNTNVKIYSKNKLIKSYDYVMDNSNSANSFTIVANHKGEVIVGGEMGK